MPEAVLFIQSALLPSGGEVYRLPLAPENAFYPRCFSGEGLTTAVIRMSVVTWPGAPASLLATTNFGSCSSCKKRDMAAPESFS